LIQIKTLGKNQAMIFHSHLVKALDGGSYEIIQTEVDGYSDAIRGANRGGEVFRNYDSVR